MKKLLKALICIVLIAAIIGGWISTFRTDVNYGVALPKKDDYTAGALNQNRITEPTALLDENGKLISPGYCVFNNYIYDRSAITAGALRIKEWDFYQLCNERYIVQFFAADISFGGAYIFTMIDMETGKHYEKMSMSLFTFGKLNLETNAEKDHTISVDKKDFKLTIAVKNGQTHFVFNGVGNNGEKISCDLIAKKFAHHESLTMAVPFEWDNYFYLDQKINCMPVEGTVDIDGEVVEFKPEDTFLLLDWGRGVWPFKTGWYWGNGSTLLADGRTFGFEIGWGFGNFDGFTENTLFISDGDKLIANKIEHIFLEKGEDWMDEWKFTSNDGRFEMTMTPVYDNFTTSRILGVGNFCHEVFGRWNGYVVLDSGEKLEIKDMFAFCEYSDNHW